MMLAPHRCMPLPYIAELFPDELLSSWLRRTAADYDLSLDQLVQHIGLSIPRPSEVDHGLSPDDVTRLADAMRMDPAKIRRCLYYPLRPSARALRANLAPVQICTNCRSKHIASHGRSVVLRGWFEFWRIECQNCKRRMSSLEKPKLSRCNPAREYPNWFAGIMPAARRGADQLHTFARRPFSSPLSPVAVLCFLSKPLPRGWLSDGLVRCGHYRVADLIVPGLSDLTSEAGFLVPGIWTAKKPVRFVTARTILLAGLSHFLADPAASLRRVQDVTGFGPGSLCERWLNTLPPHERSSMSEAGVDSVP